MPRKARKPNYRCRKNDGIDPIDTHVGQRIRERRILVGLSQTRLGEIVGPTFRQIQKYERGANRVSASMLMKMSRALNVPVAFFFQGLDQPPAPKQDDVSTTANLELAKNIGLLPVDLQHGVRSLVRKLADEFGREYAKRKAA